MNTINPDLIKIPGRACFELYNRFHVDLSVEDWEFMCKNRWFSEEPETADVEAEFGVCGAREAKNDDEANEIVQKTVNAYKRMMHADIEKNCRQLLNSTTKTVAKVDKNGNIYFEEMEA